METESFIPNKEFDIPVRLFVYAVLHKHYQAIILMFSFKFVLI